MRRKLLALVFLLATSLGALTAWLMGRPLRYEAGAAPLGPASQGGVAADAGRAPAGPEPDASFPTAVTPATPDIGGDVPTPPAITPINTRRVPTPSLQHTDNYLLVGLDHTHGVWGRADTLLVAIFDPDTGHVGVVSIPRDLYVGIPDHGPARINATLRIAARQHQDPLEVARRVVSDTLAIPIEHVITGELEVFERVVDALGGVTLDVPCAIRDDFIDTRMPSGRRVLDLASGAQHLDGVTAAMYARSRHGRSDWSRARRQQALLFALRHRLSEVGPTGYLPLLGDDLSEGVHTDMTRLQMLALARRISRVRAGRVHGLVLGSRQMTAYRTAEGRAVQIPDLPAIDQALTHLFDAPLPGAMPRHAHCKDVDAALR